MKQLFMFFIFLSLLNADNRAVKITPIIRSEQRVALVIGNNEYKGALPKLNNPINDSRAMKDILQSRGFQVIYLENASKKSMKKTIKRFSQKIKNGGVGVFYFSGHGIEVDGNNYLIPIDAEINEKSDAEFEAVPLKEIVNKMQNANNRLNIIILDACRNNPFSRGVGDGGLSKIEPRGLFVSYSTEAGKTASDGKFGENGLFTKYLIKYIQEDGLNLTEVFKKTRGAVYKASNKRQFPAIYDQTIDGDFYFTLPKDNKEKPIKIQPQVQQYIETTQQEEIGKQKKNIGNAIVKERGDYLSIVIPHANINHSKGIIRKKIVNINGIKYQNHLFTKKISWEQAKAYCQNLNWDNIIGWRVPTREELHNISNIQMYGVFDSNWRNWFNQNHSKAIVSSKGYSLFVKKDFLENMPKLSYFWSSEQYDDSHAWLINFVYGGEGLKNKFNKNYILCVKE